MFENKDHEQDFIEFIDTMREHTSSPPCEQFPDAFNPRVGEMDLVRAAKSLCQECPVKALCAEYGMKWENNGIYGGLTAHERAVLRGKKYLAGEPVANGMRLRGHL